MPLAGRSSKAPLRSLAIAGLAAAALYAMGQSRGVLLTAPAPVKSDAFVASAGSFNPPSPGGEMHLLVGRSTLIKSTSRLRRVYVSNPDVLDSFTASPYQVVVTAKAAGLSSFILWDETGRSEYYLVSADLDLEGLRRSIQQALPGYDIQTESQGGRISISGFVDTDASAAAAVKLAGLYSNQVASSLLVIPPRSRQVRLKVRIVEIDRSREEQLGVNFFSGGNNISAASTGQFPTTTSLTNPALSAGGGSSAISISDPLNLLLYNTGANVGATIKALEDQEVLQILAEPTITTLNGEKASFLSGGEFPFPVVQGGTVGFTSVTIQFRPYGVKLDFTPLLNPDGSIKLKVAPEVSALDYTNAVTISGYTIPALSTRRAETEVELASGQSFAISGLLDHRTTDILNKIPGIGDLPVLGALFRSKQITHSVVELVIIVTPTVVDLSTEPAKPAEPKLAIPLMDPAAFDKALKQKPASAMTAAPK